VGKSRVNKFNFGNSLTFKTYFVQKATQYCDSVSLQHIKVTLQMQLYSLLQVEHDH